jgi:sugar phosphate isomerase/epimerase
MSRTLTIAASEVNSSMQTTPSAAAEYVAAGFALVPLTKEKRPSREGWQQRDRTVTTIEEAVTLTGNIGLAHAYSGTACIDIDDYDVAEAWFRQHGIELAELMGQPDAVMISSGRAGRGKLLYRLPPSAGGPLRTRKPVPGLELRCGTRNGLTVQDVLPPSLHPTTQRPYVWAGGGDWRRLPTIPTEVILAWTAPEERTISEEDAARAEPVGLTDEALAHLLKQKDPDIGYDAWVKVGMALHHETQGEARGLDLWDQWSAEGDKYVGRDDLQSHYDSFGHGEGAAVTARSLMGMGASAASPDEFDVIVESIEAEAADDEPAKADRFGLHQVGALTLPIDAGYFIKHVLPRAVLGVIYGPSGSGKSFAVLDMLFAIVQGKEWRGNRTRAARVAYLCAEGQHGFTKRVNAYRVQHSLELAGLPFYAITDAPNLLLPGDVSALIKQILAAGGLDLVVVDTLAQSMAGGDENSSEDMGRAIAAAQKIARKTGAMVLLVHHSGKDVSKGSRGWSGLRAACDLEIEVSREDDDRALTVSKLKDDADGSVYPFRLDVVTVGTDTDGDPITSCVIEHVEHAPGKRKPAGEFGALVLNIVRESAELVDGTVHTNTVIDQAEARMPPDDQKPFRRREAARRTLVRLQRDGFVEIQDGQVRPI